MTELFAESWSTYSKDTNYHPTFREEKQEAQTIIDNLSQTCASVKKLNSRSQLPNFTLHCAR